MQQCDFPSFFFFAHKFNTVPKKHKFLFSLLIFHQIKMIKNFKILFATIKTLSKYY